MGRDKFVDREHAAQRLERAEAKTLALVLDADLGHTQAFGERGQDIERRRSVRAAQQRADIGHAVGIDHSALCGTKALLARRARVCRQPGKDHMPS